MLLQENTGNNQSTCPVLGWLIGRIEYTRLEWYVAIGNCS